MNFKKFNLVLVFFISFNSFSQFSPLDGLKKTKFLSEEETEISLIYDKPEELRILAFYIPTLVGVKFSGMETSIFDLRLGMYYIGKGKLNGGFSQKFTLKSLPLYHDIDSDIIGPYDPIKFSNEYEGYLNYFFVEKTDIKKQSVLVCADLRYEYYTSLNVHRINKFGLSLGVIGGKMKYDLGKLKMNLTSYYNPNTSLNEEFFEQHTNQNYLFLKAGVAYNKLTDFVVDSEKFGKKIGTVSWLFSANLLFAVQNKFQDVILGGFSPTRYVIENEFVKKNPIGFEIGAKQSTRGNTVSLDTRLRYQPGLSGRFGLMFLASVSYQIDFFHLKEFEIPDLFKFKKKKC
jgi:hypothetical protein